jgi:hypothetical protein
LQGSAETLGLVPLGWLAFRRERRPEWWWIAGAFGVSWLADIGARLGDPWLVNAVYPVSQAGIIAAVLWPRREAQLAIGLLVVAGLCVLWLEGISGPDIILETVAALVIVGSAWRSPFRGSLLVAFGLGWLAWMGYTLRPGLEMWGCYQATRVVAAAMFCQATLTPRPA